MGNPPASPFDLPRIFLGFFSNLLLLSRYPMMSTWSLPGGRSPSSAPTPGMMSSPPLFSFLIMCVPFYLHLPLLLFRTISGNMWNQDAMSWSPGGSLFKWGQNPSGPRELSCRCPQWQSLLPSSLQKAPKLTPGGLIQLWGLKEQKCLDCRPAKLVRWKPAKSGCKHVDKRQGKRLVTSS